MIASVRPRRVAIACSSNHCAPSLNGNSIAQAKTINVISDPSPNVSFATRGTPCARRGSLAPFSLMFVSSLADILSATVGPPLSFPV